MKAKYKHKFNWAELKKGDKIKVVGGHGPYMIVDNKKHNIGVPSGQYSVQRVSGDGVHAYQGISHFFIYMGKEKKTMIGFSAPHKLKKVLTTK